jgi:hypothetical protein
MPNINSHNFVLRRHFQSNFLSELQSIVYETFNFLHPIIKEDSKILINSAEVLKKSWENWEKSFAIFWNLEAEAEVVDQKS